MKYALHASLHRPARRPDQTLPRDGSDRAAVDFSSDELTERPRSPDVSEAALPFRPMPFSPPPPTVIVNAYGRPAVISATPPSMVTEHDRPTLRFPVVPPPVTPPQLNVPEPLIDINEPTLEEKPVRVETNQLETNQQDPRAEIAERQTEEIQSPLAAGTYPGDLSDDPEDADETGDTDQDVEEDRGAKTRITSLQPRKKGQPPRQLARASGTTPPASQDTSDGIPQPTHIDPIDPAAWLADEAQARTSDRRDAADGVDNSDTIVPIPRTRPHVV